MGDIQDHADRLALSQKKIADLEQRERNAVQETDKYKKINEDLTHRIIRLGGKIHDIEDDLDHEKEDRHADNKAIALRIMQNKINDLEKKLSCALWDLQDTASSHNTLEIQERLTVQNKKLLDKVDRLQTKNAKVSGDCSLVHICAIFLINFI